MTEESSKFEMEDQADEEFCDNFVEGEDDNDGLVNKELDETRMLMNNCTNVLTNDRVVGISATNVKMDHRGR